MTDHAPRELQDAIASLIARRPDLGLDIRWHATLPSTMDAVALAATAGAPAGVAIVAGEQTAGRGRRGHTWSSPAGAGLYLSLLARPTRRIELITLAAGVGVREGIAEAAGLWPDLKWPNDLLVGRRKLAGLLAEGTHVGTGAAAVTIGAGINLRPSLYPPDVAARATCVESEIGRRVRYEAVCVTVIERLADALRDLEHGGADDILRRWRDAAPAAEGTPVTWSERGVECRGVTAGIDDSGALLVATASGVTRIIAGELTWHLP